MQIYFLALLVLTVGVTSNPQKYHFVSTAQFEDVILDKNMHPDQLHNNARTKHRQSELLEKERTSEYWLSSAKAFVEEQVKRNPNLNKAKNIILFLGDGMSHPSVTSARVYLGGEEKKLSFESFPYTASSKTYCVDAQVADSACTGTAYLSGVKTNDGVIGLGARALRGHCTHSNDAGRQTPSIAQWALNAGKDAGFVTTTRITHASPACLYAHISERDWENDYEVSQSGCNSEAVNDIAEQLVHGEVGKKLKVIMGGGARNFVDQSLIEHGSRGLRRDGKNLINEWMAADSERTVVRNKQQLLSLNPSNVKQLLGLFSSNHINYNLDVQRDNMQDLIPSLTEMTLKAIDILNESDDGYFLFVEGGRIDHGHHDNQAKYAVDETAEFSKAIEAAMAKINLNETLVVVTADHGHVMTISGYADRGADIFGTAGTGQDNIPYMTLSYANGMGFYDHFRPEGGRVDVRNIDQSANDFRFPATVPLDDETHGGEDVGVWAVGPWAHLLQGTLEQNVIPHVMAYASCIGEGMTMCDEE